MIDTTESRSDDENEEAQEQIGSIIDTDSVSGVTTPANPSGVTMEDSEVQDDIDAEDGGPLSDDSEQQSNIVRLGSNLHRSRDPTHRVVITDICT